MTYLIIYSNGEDSSTVMATNAKDAVDRALALSDEGYTIYILDPDNRRYDPNDFAALIAANR